MKLVLHVLAGLSIVFAAPAIAGPTARTAQTALPGSAHVNAVHDLLKAMRVENLMRRVAYRSRYPSERQRQEAIAKFEKTPASEIHRRLALPLAQVISADTAIEMTRFYNTPAGKQVIHKKYNSGPQMVMPGMSSAVPKEGKKGKRAAFFKANKELSAAEPAVEHEVFKLLQKIHNGR